MYPSSLVCFTYDRLTYPTLTRNHDRGDRHVNDDETQTRCIAHRRVPASSDTLSSMTLGASAHQHRRLTSCDPLSHEYGMAYNSPSVARITRCVRPRQTRIDARDVPRSDARLRLSSSRATLCVASRRVQQVLIETLRRRFCIFPLRRITNNLFFENKVLNTRGVFFFSLRPDHSSAANPRARTRKRKN